MPRFRGATLDKRRAMGTLNGRKWPGALKGRYCAIQQHKSVIYFRLRNDPTPRANSPQ